MLNLSDIPRDADGLPLGVFRLRLGTVTESYPGAAFVDGVAERVTGLPVRRMAEAFGTQLAIEPGDAETAEACARAIYERTGDGARAKSLRALYPKRGKRGERGKRAQNTKAA